MTPWALQLAQYRRRVAELYATARAGGPGEATWSDWRDGRDALIGTHDQSPLPPDRRTGEWRTPFFEHDPSWRVSGVVEETDTPRSFQIDHSGDGATRFTEIGSVRFEVAGIEHVVSLFWLDAYGGGLFLPFRDATAGTETYGGGRYLLDSAKGADLGSDGDGRLVLDFNYAYHPSCAWDSAWSCPLAPPSNRLEIPIRAGERLPLD